MSYTHVAYEVHVGERTARVAYCRSLKEAEERVNAWVGASRDYTFEAREDSILCRPREIGVPLIIIEPYEPAR